MRNNSVFWLASGYNLQFGLTGGVIKSGTFQQFIRGGIAFATPPTIPLAPKATPNKHFLLNPEEPKDWKPGYRHSARLNFAFSSGPGIAGPCFFRFVINSRPYLYCTLRVRPWPNPPPFFCPRFP